MEEKQIKPCCLKLHVKEDLPILICLRKKTSTMFVLILLTFSGTLREWRRENLSGNYVILEFKIIFSNHVKLANLLNNHMYKSFGPPCLVQMMLLVNICLSLLSRETKHKNEKKNQKKKRKKRGGKKFQIFGRSGSSRRTKNEKERGGWGIIILYSFV